MGEDINKRIGDAMWQSALETMGVKHFQELFMNDETVVKILRRNKTAMEIAQWPPQISRDDVRKLIADTERAIHWLEDEDRSVNCMECGVELTAKSIAYCVECCRDER